MHDTAMTIGKLFFELYCEQSWKVAIDCGALDINGTLRTVSPSNLFYIGIDLEHGPSVDILARIGEPLPFRDDFADCVISSSQMEHDDFFWVTFLEYARVTKPGGCIYINVPSNGAYHRHPNDNWRFYPDCGHVFVRWARRNGFELTLVESFISRRDGDTWNDYVAVFKKANHEHRTEFIADRVPSMNVWKGGAAAVERPHVWSEDQQMLTEALSALATQKSVLLEAQAQIALLISTES